jgi:hypothetical protein
MNWLIVEAKGDGSGDVIVREHGTDAHWRLTNDDARKLARRLVSAADSNECAPPDAPRGAHAAVAGRKLSEA